MFAYNKSHPFLSRIKDRFLLCKPGSVKETQHVVLDLHGSGLTYEVGDSLGIFAIHDSALVKLTIHALRATGHEEIQEKNSETKVSLTEFLTRKANITEISRKLITEVAQRQTNSQKKKHFEFLLAEENKDAFKEYQASHQLWDFLSENEEVVFDLQEICHLLKPMLPRFYSIASSMKAVGEEVHLTVAHLSYHTNGHLRQGVCTHYLCHLTPLHESIVPIFIQPSHGFSLPQDQNVPIIMVGPGTGIAPFRAFMQERMALNSSAKHWLFFGECHHEYEYFYEDYWKDLQSQGSLRLDLAFSRDQEHKVYVQHKMLEQASDLFQWLEEGACLYVCGDAHRMAKDVDAVLHQIIREEGKRDEKEAKLYIKELKSQKRYLRDVY
jgi:sulfite reductase (NADPH) flavoprotein alpha-component